MPTFARDFSPEDIHANPAYYREPINLLVRDANGDAEQIARIQSFLHKRICLALSCFVDKSDVHILDFYLNISQSIIAGITGHKIMFPAMSFSDAVEDAYLSDRRATRDALVGIDRSTDLASVHSFKSPFESLAIAVGLGWGEEFKNLLSSNGYELINLSPSLCETYFPDGNLFHLPWRSVKMFLNRARRTYVYILESPKSAACFPLLASECTIDMCWLNSLYMYIAYPLYTSAGKALAKSPIKALFVVDHLRKFKVAFSTSEWDPSEPHECVQFSHCPHNLRFVTDSIGFYFSLRSVPHASDIYGDLSRYGNRKLTARNPLTSFLSQQLHCNHLLAIRWNDLLPLRARDHASSRSQNQPRRWAALRH